MFPSNRVGPSRTAFPVLPRVLIMQLWAWALIAFGAGILLLVLDIFIPSGGALATISAISLVLAIVLGFMSGTGVGVSILFGTGIVIPTIIAFAIKFWPQTPLGRLILLQPPENPDDVLPDDDDQRSLKNLIGQQGRAKCVMLPSGIVEIDHRSYDAVSEGMPIEAGQPVEVLSVQTNRIVVRPIEKLTPIARPDDVLSRPIESIGLDSTDNPLG